MPMDTASRRVLLGALLSGWKPSGTACTEEKHMIPEHTDIFHIHRS